MMMFIDVLLLIFSERVLAYIWDANVGFLVLSVALWKAIFYMMLFNCSWQVIVAMIDVVVIGA